MLRMIHEGGHRYLKILFLLACAGSSAMFFAGPALPNPPKPVVILIALLLGIAIEWGYCTFSCDLTEAITERNGSGIPVSLVYTLIGGAASWFLFTNAAISLHWAPKDHLTGLSQTQWAMLMAALVVLIIFALSARRERVKEKTDLQAIARSISIMLPDAPPDVQLRLLSTIAGEAAKHMKALPTPNTIEPATQQALPAAITPVETVSPNGKVSSFRSE